MATTSVDQVTGYGETVAYKAPCRLATTANITLSGLQTIDGVAVAANDRVLVKDQADARYHGIYIASSGLWLRARDFDSNRDISSGTQIFVTAGALNARSGWSITTANPIIVGTTDIVIEQSELVNAAQLEALEEAAAASATSASDAEDASAAWAAAAAASAATVNLPTIVANTMLVAKPDGSGYLAKVAADVRDFLDTPVYVATRTAMKALTPTKDLVAMLQEAGREGTFVVKAGAPPVTDTQEGIYVVSNTAGFYWKRVDAAPDIAVFGAVQNGVTDDSAAIQASLDVLGYANVLEWKGSTVKVNNIRLKDSGNLLQGFGWPKLISSAGTVINVENSYQTVRGFLVDGTLQTVGNPVIRLKTDLRGMTTVNIESLYLTNCGAGIMDMNNGVNLAIFVNIRDVTMAGHRGYGIATWDCWASYHIDQVVVSRVSMVGTDYNFPAFYFNGAEGIFFRNCAQNGSAATSVQPLQDGVVFEDCNFVVFENFIPDHSGGRGMAFLACNNVRGGDSTLANSVDHGFYVSGGSLFALDNIYATQLATLGLANKDAFSVNSCLTFRATNLHGAGYTRHGFLGNVMSRGNVQGEFTVNGGRGIVTTGAGLVNLFHGCLTASNTTGNYSLAGSSDYLRDHIVSAGTITDVTGPATA
ncbi:hypothetical protein LB521_09230 [Mesorhizobium sp. BR-1-1-8]|uniref:hypothetical protein n=1 Tax=unclassified Mesorhizobium TaxID=325217 RepID=UPI0011281385|nr:MULTISPECIES: hypothetical protein [unclassified Mesorhizobium]MBZ9981340.1 hypothetical protein [Mesorhizobium sp. BR-1-1-8]TPL33730.1 hypothetical protein FJ947_19265 [Mesorhizobium sp. B2-4-8]